VLRNHIMYVCPVMMMIFIMMMQLLLVVLMMMIVVIIVCTMRGALHLYISRLGKGCKLPGRRTWENTSPRPTRKKHVKTILKKCACLA